MTINDDFELMRQKYFYHNLGLSNSSYLYNTVSQAHKQFSFIQEENGKEVEIEVIIQRLVEDDELEDLKTFRVKLTKFSDLIDFVTLCNFFMMKFDKRFLVWVNKSNTRIFFRFAGSDYNFFLVDNTTDLMRVLEEMSLT